MASKNRYGVILAGGRGARFWPLSRRKRPKQLLPFLSERSLLQETVARLRPLIPPERIWVLANEELRRAVIRQLPEVPARQVLAEPVARNTAPAIGLAAEVIRQNDPDAVLGIFPSDHHIERPGRFRVLARTAFGQAEQGKLTVLGIAPRWAETGYGYIEFPAGAEAGQPAPILRFLEKPDLKTARRLLAAKRFSWNAGMFFWRADVFLDQLRRHLPKTRALLAALPPLDSRRFRTCLRDVFPRMENISVDYAVLEQADEVHGVIAGDIGWNDLGSWNAVHDLLAGSPSANATRSETLLVDATGNYVEAPGKLVALLGVKNLIVVETPDATLIVDRSRAQDVRDLVKLLESSGRDDLL